MEKKITKKIRKKVAECMNASLDAVEIMRVSKASGINADAVCSNCLDVNYLLKIVVLYEDEEIDDLEFEFIDHSASTTPSAKKQSLLPGSVLMGASRMLRSSLKGCSDGNATLHAA